MKSERHDLNDSHINIPIPENYHDCMTLVRSDRYREGRQGEGSITILLKSFVQAFFSSRSPSLTILC